MRHSASGVCRGDRARAPRATSSCRSSSDQDEGLGRAGEVIREHELLLGVELEHASVLELQVAAEGDELGEASRFRSVSVFASSFFHSEVAWCPFARRSL